MGKIESKSIGGSNISIANDSIAFCVVNAMWSVDVMTTLISENRKRLTQTPMESRYFFRMNCAACSGSCIISLRRRVSSSFKPPIEPFPSIAIHVGAAVKYNDFFLQLFLTRQ